MSALLVSLVGYARYALYLWLFLDISYTILCCHFILLNPSPMPWLSLWYVIALLKERIWPFRQNMSIKLMLSTLGKILKYFSYFSQKTEFDISCKLSSSETICMKCQILFCEKIKKNVISLSSAELVWRVVKVNLQFWKVSDTREATPCL